MQRIYKHRFYRSRSSRRSMRCRFVSSCTTPWRRSSGTRRTSPASSPSTPPSDLCTLPNIVHRYRPDAGETVCPTRRPFWSFPVTGQYWRPRQMIGSLLFHPTVTIITPQPYDTRHKSMLLSINPSACLFRFLILPRSLDGGMRTLLFQTRSIGGSTVGYVRIQMLSAGSIASPRNILLLLGCIASMHVCLNFWHECCTKTAEPINMPFAAITSGFKEPCTRRRLDPKEKRHSEGVGCFSPL